MWEYSIIVSTKISFLFMSILIFLEDSFNITWTKWWTNIVKQKLVMFSPNEIKNLVSLTIHCLSFQIHRPISQSTFMVPRLPMEPPPWFHRFFRRLLHAHFIPCGSEVIFVFFDENLCTFLTSKPLKCFEILKSWRQHWQF